VGDWSIVVDTPTNTLSGPAEGIVHTTAATGQSDPDMKVTVTCKDVESGDVFRVLVNYDITTDRYLYGQLACTGSGADNMTLSVGYVDGDGETESASYTFSHDINEDMSLGVCRNLEGIYAGTSDVSQWVWSCIGDNSGRYAGLMNNSDSNTLEFDDFQFLRGYDANGRCFTCACDCEGECLPDTLRLTFSGDGLCDCIDDEYMDITVVTNQDTIYWEGTANVYNWDGCTFTTPATLQVVCAPDLEDWSLVDIGNYPSGFAVTLGWLNDGTYNYAKPNMALSTCDPLYVVFGPFGFTVTPPCDPCDCTYYFILTEVPT
jgi:hypothetical protein